MEPTPQATAPYKVNLPIYDGPLDLLLDLIRKQEMNIHDIPIAKITGQYLDYLRKLEELDVDVSADFIYMAATLILIKSKMLLPPDPLALAEERRGPASGIGAPAGGARKIQERGAVAGGEAAAVPACVVEAGYVALRKRRDRRRSWSFR